MYSFVLHCPELITDDVTRRLLPPLECALTMTVQLVYLFSVVPLCVYVFVSVMYVCM